MRQRRGRRERSAQPSGPPAGHPGAGNGSVEPTTLPDGIAPPAVSPAGYGPPWASGEPNGPTPGPAAPSAGAPMPPPEPRPRYDAPPATGQWRRYDSQPQPGTWPAGDRQPGSDRRPDGWQPGFDPARQHDSRPLYRQPPPGPGQPVDQTWRRDQAWSYDQPRSYDQPQTYDQRGYQPGPPFEPPRDPRQPWPRAEPPSQSEPWPQAEPPRQYETRQPFEPLTRADGRQTGPQPRYTGPPFPPGQPLGHPAVGQPLGHPAVGQPFPSSPAPAQPTVVQATAPAPGWAGQIGQGQPGPDQAGPGGQAQPPKKRRRRRLIVVVVVVVVLLLGAGAAGGGYLLLRTLGSPGQTAANYLAAWQRGDYPAMNRVSLDVPRGGLAGPLTAAAAQLGVRHASLALGAVTANGNTAQARFTVTDELASNHVWSYRGTLSLAVVHRHWWVKWSPSAIYPGLRAGERFALTALWPPRAEILADDGTVLSSPDAIAESGSLALLTGYLGKATAAQAKALGEPYRKGDVIGLSGLEQTFQTQLAGRPALTIKIVGPGKRVDTTAMRFAAKLGTPVRTSINMAAQIAASHAVSSAKTNKPVDMVAMQASTGRVLAVVERPGGYDRVLQGIFPPGSTFKVVTASALAKLGFTPSSTVQCPSQVTIDGRTFHNDKNEHLGTTNLQTAFAVSCNSTFALLATQRLTGATLGSMARVFGFNATPELGLPAALGQFTTPRDPVALAADAFGQGTDLVNPLSQASEVAAIDSGEWRPPVLVVSPKVHQKYKPHVISPAILDTLRPMMLAVVTSGTAAGVGFPPGVYGKTGTAEYGTGPHPSAHGWFIGYQGDIAFAVLVEGGGYGANSAGPIANAFLRKLGG